jgi:hypothetical protein
MVMGGTGGSNPLGFGGASIALSSISSSSGIAGNGYGSGGAGCCLYQDTGTVTGGAGKSGIAIFTEYI